MMMNSNNPKTIQNESDNKNVIQILILKGIEAR